MYMPVRNSVWSICFVVSLITGTAKAQLTGIKTIPGDYPTISAAVNDLNIQGVGNGGVTFHVAAGHTETISSVISLTATGTLGDPIVFQKNGSGANPLITAYTGGTGTPSSASQDGIWRLVGSDYVTIDGIDLTDNPANTTNPSTMEYGYALYKASNANGCQYVTIQNCTITLNRVNNASGSGPMVDGSVGINMTNATPAAATTTLTVSGSAGANSNNRFYRNMIQNCNIGISMIGYADASPFNNADTGNDVGGNSLLTGNTVRNYGGGGTANPAAAVRTLAQYGLNISYNTVDNNDGGGINHGTTLRGIYVNTATSASATVSNNTITIRGGATTSTISAIENVSGSTAANNTISLNNNTITNCTYATGTSGIFYGIYNNGSTSANCSISGNTFISNAIANTSGVVSMIYNTGVNSVSLTISNNTFTNNATTTTGNTYLIYNSNNTASSAISNNAVSGTFTKTGSGNNFYGYYNFGSPGVGTTTISGNNFSNISVSGTTAFYGIYQATTVTQVENVINNTVSNITVGTGVAYGIFHNYGATGNLVNDNTISNITAGGTLYGISLGSSTASTSLTASGNAITGLSSTGASTVYGIYLAYGTTNHIFKNKIANIQCSNASGVVYGIAFVGGTSASTHNIYNNLVGDLRTPLSTSTSDAIRGISITSASTTSNVNVYYNTVFLNATSSGTNFSTSGLFHTTSATATTSALTLRNNIIVNTSTPNGSGFAIAYRRSSTTLTNYAAASNNNLLYGGTPGTTRLIFYDGTNADQTLTAFKSRVGTARETYSVTENPPFLSTAFASPDFLHIDPAIATQAESGGANILGFTDDFDGQVRQGNIGYSGTGSAPDIGADEMNGILLDLMPPVISYNLLLSGCGTGNRTVTGITITDATGVPTSGAFRPRIYYKKGVGGSWFSQPGTLATGTAQNGTWDFTVVAADMGGLVLGDQVFYYVIAQDASLAASISANPGAGMVATDVNTVNTPPSSPNSYSVIDILPAGTYTVGSGGNYATLTAAVADYNQKCIGGPIVFSLTDALYSSSETFPIIINQNSGASAINTLTIRPAGGNTASITGSLASGALIRVLGNYVKIDGSNNSTDTRDLTITNNSATSPIVMLFGSVGTVPVINSSLMNTTIINGVNTSSALVVSDASTAGNPGYFNNIILRNNSIQKAYIGIYTNAAVVSGNGAGLHIDSNSLVTSGANAIRYTGIYVQGADGATVSANQLENFESATAEDDRAIWFATGTRNSTIARNVINNIGYSGTGGYGGFGIYITTGVANAGVLIVNNMISGIYGDGYDYTNATYTLDNPTGILVSGIQTGINIYYNTISMNGNTLNQTNAISSGIRLFTGSVANIRNNIISNNLGRLGSVGYGAIGVLASTSNTQFGIINHNDYYVDPSGSGNKFIGQIGTTGQAALAGWQGATGQDANSLNIQPNFISPTDLHMDPVMNLSLDNTGTPIAGITTDIDGDTRSLTIPDMGADEFLSPACSGANGGTISPAAYNICDNQTVALTSSGADVGVGMSYQWKVSNVPGGPYVNVTGGTGATTPAYTSDPLAPGTYYYVLEAQCSFGSLVGLSNEATVNVYTYPTASASNDAPVCEGENINLTGTTDIGVTFAWTGPNSYTSSSQSPTLTGVTVAEGGTYSFVATANGCSSAPATTVVVVNPGVGTIAATASQNSVCLGNAIDLNASGQTSGVILSEDFNGQVPGWTTVNNSTGGTPANAAWTLRPSPYSPGGAWVGQFSTISSNDNSQYYFTNSDAQGNGGTTNTILQAPAINSVGYSGLTLDFYHYYRDIADAGDNAYVEVSTDGIAWTTVQTYTSDQGAPTAFANASINLNAYVNYPSLYIRFRYTGTWDWGWAIDNVSINGVAPSLTYSWTSNPSGFTSNLQNPTGIMPSVMTDYQVVVSNSFGCSDSAVVTVSVNPNPVVSIGNDTAYCQGISFSAAYDAGNPGSTYNWSNGATTQVINAVTQGTYSVIVTDNNGCMGYDTAVVTENPAPVVNIGNDTSYCQGVSFSATYDAGNPGNTFNWSTGATTQSISVNAAGTYSVIVTNNNNCAGYDTVVVIQHLNPVVSVGNDTAYCQGITFSSTYNAGNPGSTYSWSTGATTQSIAVTGAGTYSVIVTDNNNCTGYDTVVVTEYLSPAVNIGNDTAYCQGVNFSSIYNAGNPGSTYNWSTGAQTQSVSVTGPGTYSVIVTDVNGCSGYDTVVVTQHPVPVVNLGNDIITQTGPVVLDAGNPGNAYNWSTGAQTQTISVNTNGTYFVVVTNGFGCTGSDTIQVTFTLSTPNEDGSAARVILYPNPTADMVYISIENLQAKRLSIELLDMSGRVISNDFIENPSPVFTHSINVYMLPAGAYMIRLTTEYGTDMLRLIKK